MFERGESSRAAEEVQCRDVPVVSVQPYGPGRRPVVATVFPDDPDYPEEEHHQREVSEPVRGRVFSTGSQDSDGESEEDPTSESEPEDSVPETEPEEQEEIAPQGDDEPQDSPVFYQPGGFPDGMGSTADDIIEGMTGYQQELEERIEHLELQNQIHQHREDQYRDVAYQTIGQRDELTVQLAVRDQTIVTLEGQVQQGQHSAEQAGSLVHQVVARSTTLSQRLEGAELEMAGLHEEVSALRAELDRERAHRLQTEQDLFRAERQVQGLQTELQRRDRRTDSFDDALTASLVRVRRRVYEQMARREIRRAVRRRRD